MSGLVMTREDARAALLRKGVPVVAIERALDLEYGVCAPSGAPIVVTPAARPQLVFPFRLVVPWSQLCSDNDRVEPFIRMTAAGPAPAKRLTDRYKAAKAAIEARARDRAGDVEPSTAALSIIVDVWLPPARRNDSINFAKLIGDALEGIVYANDNQLHRSLWVRAGVDIDAPRAEILIEPVA